MSCGKWAPLKLIATVSPPLQHGLERRPYHKSHQTKTCDRTLKRLERSRHWVWTAMAPTSKLLVVVEVGSRTLAMAQRVVHQVTEVLALGCVPLFVTDGLKDYGTALLTHFGQW